MRQLSIALFCLISISLSSQCFYPPSGSTLYSTTNVAAYGTANTGFETLGDNLSGSWSISSTSGVTAAFTDDSGRLSSISLSGTGTLVIDNTVDDINTSTTVATCQQTFTVANYSPVVNPNPSIAVPCPINIVLLLDESGSIGTNMAVQTIKDATLALADNLEDTGSKMAIVEFSSTATKVTIGSSFNLQDVNASYTANLSSYLNSDYNPIEDPTRLIGGTNWEDAFLKASEISDADLIIMLTDGNPTFYNVPGGMVGSMSIAGEGDMFDLTALKEAQDVANTIKNAGTHIFVAGLNFPSNIQAIRDVTGNVELPTTGSIADLVNADYSVVTPSELVAFFSSVGSICAPPVETIPTLGEWSLMCLFLFLGIIGVVTLRQRSIVTIG